MQRSIVCQLWNFKTVTLDVVIPAPPHPDAALQNEKASTGESGSFLADLKDQLSTKLATSSKDIISPDTFRLMQNGKNLTD